MRYLGFLNFSRCKVRHYQPTHQKKQNEIGANSRKNTDFIENKHPLCAYTALAMRWYSEGLRPVTRLNTCEKLERLLMPTLSAIASMVTLP